MAAIGFELHFDPAGGGVQNGAVTEQVELRGEDGLRLVADAYGPADGPPAYFFHGSGQTRQSWGRAATELGRQGWRAYTVDHRGHGDSDRHDAGGYEHHDVAQDVLALCAAERRRPLVVGASLGGSAALVAQGEVDAQLYRGLVLVDITPTVDIAGARRIITFMSANPDGFATLEEAAAAIGAYRGADKGAPSPQGLTRVLRRNDAGRWNWHWDPRLLDSRRPWLDDPAAATAAQERLRGLMTGGAQRLDVPVLLVRGASSDVVTPDAARELLQIVPHATYVDVTDAGHMVAGDRNDAFTAAVLAFAAPLLEA